MESTTSGKPDASVTASPGHPVTSPSGASIVEVDDVEDGGVRAWKVRVKRTSDGAVELAPNEAYSLQSRTFVLWDDRRDRLWVYSGDVGTKFWDRDDAGTWKPQSWYESGQVAPAFLRAAVPERFR